MQQPIKTPFRFDINALRAIAILGVLLYHFKVPLFKGGFAGVDVFFVISGYLMTRVIIVQIDNGIFTFSTYFEKRLYRIVPALLFLVAMVMLTCFFLYLPYDYKANLHNAESSILFLSNIYYWYNTPSYFDASADTNLFLHTWSLSVEWQFYLVYPFILFLFKKALRTVKAFKLVFLLFTLILFIVSIAVSYYYNSSFSFYMLPTRAWEMLIGGVAFFADGKIKNVAWQKVIAINGYLLILLSFITLNELVLWPGFYTLVPAAGVFAVIVANCNSFIAIRQKALQFTGRISYSLYLWHWPVYVVAQYYGLGTGTMAVSLYCVLSVAMGYASYKYIEPQQFKRKRVVVVCAVILLAGIFTADHYDANRFIYTNKTLLIANSVGIKQKPFYNQYRKDTCFVESMRIFKNEPCLCFADGKKNILLIGDSHLAQLAQSLQEGFKAENIHFLQATAPGTLPTVKNYYHKKNNLRELMDYIYRDFVPKNADRIDGVVLSGNWAGQSLVAQDSLLHGIKDAVTYLNSYQIKVLVIGQTERYTVSYPAIAARSNQFKSHNQAFYLDQHTLLLNGYFKHNLRDVYINVLNENAPPLSGKNVTYMRDKDHVTKYGADLLVAKIKKDTVWKQFLLN